MLVKLTPGYFESAQPMPHDVTPTKTFFPFSNMVRGPVDGYIKIYTII
jgi:hypothetical protein